jgi:hypothetical protein
MKYIVLMQFIPGLDQIWVARLNPEDPTYEFDTYEECTAKAAELQVADETGRQYKASIEPEVLVESVESEIPTESEVPTESEIPAEPEVPTEPEVPVESIESEASEEQEETTY